MHHFTRNLTTAVAATAIIAGASFAIPRTAQADQTSTALYAVGAAAIVGALLYDGNNRPYYLNNNRRYYVSDGQANYYRSHHHGYQRNAWVPENEYPVQENNGYRPQGGGMHGGDMHGGDMHGGDRGR